MSIQRKLYFDRIDEKAVKGTKKRDEPFTVVAIKNNKVVDQFAGAEYDELSEVIEYMKKNNPGAKISVEKKRGGVVHTESVELDENAPATKIIDAAMKRIGIGYKISGQVIKVNPLNVGRAKEELSKVLKRKGTDMNKTGMSVIKDKRVPVSESVELDEETYDEFFAKAMKKFGISSPADFKDEKKKKEFFNYVDKNYKAKDESIEEDEMSDDDMKQREKIVKGLKKNKKDFEDRYGEKAMDVMYATATKMAMKDSVDYDEANDIIERYLKRD